MLIIKEKYMQIKEIVLYLFGLSFFYNFDISKIFLSLMILFILIDIFYFKEKLECGNDKLRNFIFFLVIGGTIWNFMADFNYRAARAYLKINRYAVIIFYLYPLVKYKKEILRNFLISILLSYCVLLFKGIKFYELNKNLNYYRFDAFEGVMDVAVLVAVVSAFFFGNLIQEKDKKLKIINLILFLSSLFLIVITQTRASMLALIGAAGCMLIFNKNLKLIIASFILGCLLLFGFMQTPQAKRFKTNTFNVKVSTDNMSNGLRVEMWKNAIWRFKQHPIMGSGTKQDYELFSKYVENMPETTETEKIYKNVFRNGFDDAHCMYLNALTDNGLFFLVQLIFIFAVLPYILIVNKNYKYRLPLVGGLSAYYIFGVVWPIWRHGWDPMLLWTLIALLCCGYIYKDTKEIKNEK